MKRRHAPLLHDFTGGKTSPLLSGMILSSLVGAGVVVLKVRADVGGQDALLAISRERWAWPGEVVERLGRVKGVSRIDQAKK